MDNSEATTNPEATEGQAEPNYSNGNDFGGDGSGQAYSDVTMGGVEDKEDGADYDPEIEQQRQFLQKSQEQTAEEYYDREAAYRAENVRLTCLLHVLQHGPKHGVGSVERMVEAATKYSDFVTNGSAPRPADGPAKD